MKDYLKVVGWLVLTLVVFGGIGLGVRSCSKAEKATHLQDAVIVYEQYQEIFNTCTKLNTDLCNMKSLDKNDKMFEQFSKAQRINTIKTNLNRWVEDYNAKSKMWGRSLWRSSQLPYQLTNEQFNCNN